MDELFVRYAESLRHVLENRDWSDVYRLVTQIQRVWRENKSLFLCGNGGSAGNAIHLANDFLYGVAEHDRRGIRAEALSANPAVLTCLANDLRYEDIFSTQIVTKGVEGDLLIVLSGSGNSPNVLEALASAAKMNIQTFAIVGYDGGICRKIADDYIHIQADDMQIAEDCQLVVGHMCMKWLKASGPASERRTSS